MKRFGKSSTRNSNKSLSLKSGSCLSPGFDEEGKQEHGTPQRSLSMEQINNHVNTLGSAKSKDLKQKLNSGGIYDTMISSKMSSVELHSLSRKKKSTTSVLSNPIPTLTYNSNNKNTPSYNNNTTTYNNNNNNTAYNNNKTPPSYTREYSAYSDSNVLRNHSSNSNTSNNNNNSSPIPVSNTPNILDNIENTLYSGTLVSTPHFTSAPGGDTTNELDRSEAEARLCKLRQELDRKRIFIKNMKMSLDTVDSSDNIDIRIQHAELEYQLGKEELNLLNILEEFRNLQNSIESNFKSEGYFQENLSIYNYIVKHCSPSDTLTLHAVQVPYDSKCPKFGLSYRDENNGLYVEWTSESQSRTQGLCKGDRILEINNHLIVQNNNRTELIKLLKLLPQTKLVVLRTAPAQVSVSSPTFPSAKDLAPPPSLTKPDEAEKIQNDNVRLTHRISYLEEQVAELLQKVNKGQTFHTSSKPSRTKNKYLETSLCSSTPYETKDFPNQRALDPQQLADDDEEMVFQKGNKIKTLLKNQKYAKEKLDKVLEKTKKFGDRDEGNNQRYSVDDCAKENRQSLSRKYKTLEKCNPSKYHRRKKSESSLVGMDSSTNTLKSNFSDTETYIPKIKSKSLIYLNKSQSDYNYPLVSPLHGSEKSINSLSVNHESLHDHTLNRLSGERVDKRKEDDESYRKTYTFPIVKYNSDKNIRKVIDAKIYEENERKDDVNLLHQRLEYSNSLDRLEDRNNHFYDELNRKLGVCEPDEKCNTDGNTNHVEENRLLIQTNVNKELVDSPCERLARLYVVNETNHSKETGDSRPINNFLSDSKEAFNYSTQGGNAQNINGGSNHQIPLENNYHPHATSRISIEFMDKNHKVDSSRAKSNSANECYEKEPNNNNNNNNNELYRIEKAIFNELHEECINKLDKSPEQKRIEMEKNELATLNGAKDLNVAKNIEERDKYCSNQYDDFVRNKQSLDRIYDKYFHDPDSGERGGTLKDAKNDKHRYPSRKEILKNKFKNEKYVDIDNDNEIPLSRNVEKLNNNFKEFWKIKSYKKNSLGPTAETSSKHDGIEKSQSETNFNDYERKLIGNCQYPSLHEDSRKFNENTRMSKYELDDKIEKEKLTKSFLLSNSHSRTKPIPPKKPARLSLQRAASLQSVNSVASVMTHNSDSQTKKPIKRSYRGDTSYLTMSMQNTGNERWC